MTEGEDRCIRVLKKVIELTELLEGMPNDERNDAVELLFASERGYPPADARALVRAHCRD